MPRWACTRIRRASRSRAASASGPRAALHPAVYRSFQAASKASTSICVVSGSREVGVVGGPTRFMPNTLRSLPVSTTRNGEKSFVAYPTPETACRPSLSLCAHQVAGAWSPLASAVTRRSRSRQPPARYARAPSSAHASAGLPARTELDAVGAAQPHRVANFPYLARGPEAALIEARGKKRWFLFLSVHQAACAPLQLGQISYAVVN